jgi:hypothetical protein
MNEQKTKTVQALDSVITSIYNIEGDRWERAGKLLEVVWTELKRDAEVEDEIGVAFYALYAMLRKSSRQEAEECLGFVAQAQAIWLGEEGGDKQGLINDVIEQIKRDVKTQDMTAIEELLRFVPDEHLSSYLSELDYEALPDWVNGRKK